MHFSCSKGWTLGGFLPYTLPREMAGEINYTNTFSTDDHKWMFIALLEGMKGSGISNPNPSVGCVITRQGTQVSQGATEPYKLRHAERVAVDSLSSVETLTGHTAYVTLEPCCHKGHQPACVDLLIEKKVSRVVIATMDPNPKVNGEGINRLKKNGVLVEVGVLQNEAVLWHLPFLAAQVLKRPVLIGKWAKSSDGLLAEDNGDSKWITGEKSRAYSHWLRQKYDAVLVGAGTALKDSPKLTVRNCREPILRQPLRIVLDPKGRIQEITPNLLTSTFSKDAPTVLLTSRSEAPKGFPKQATLAKLDPERPIASFQEWLVGKPVQSVFIEGGSGILNLFLNDGVLDILHVFTGEKTLTGSKNQVNLKSDSKTFKKVVETQIEGDTLQEYVRQSLIDSLCGKSTINR